MKQIRTVEELAELVGRDGYSVVLFSQAADHASAAMRGHIAAMRRKHILFAEAPVENVGAGYVPSAFTPTVAVYKRGAISAVVVGSDFERVNCVIDSLGAASADWEFAAIAADAERAEKKVGRRRCSWACSTRK